MDGFQRRTAHPTDVHCILGWFRTRTEAIFWAGPTVPESLTAEWLTEQLKQARYWVWLDPSGNTQGVFALNFKKPGCARFGRFALSPDLRGQGLAKDFLQDAVDLARSLGATELSLGVYGSNRVAKRVYEQAGFQVVEEKVAEEDPTGVNYEMRLNIGPP